MVQEYPPRGPFHELVGVLAGEIRPDELRETLASLPRFLRNDAWLALAIRAERVGNRGLYTLALQEVLRTSVPVFEWPAPLAQQWLKEGRKG